MAETTYKQAFTKMLRDKLFLPDVIETEINFEKTLKTVEAYSERAEKDDERFAKFDLESLKTASDEAVELAKLYSQLGYCESLLNLTFLSKYFKSLSLEKSKISSIDQSIKQFTRLKRLNLSMNQLKIVSVLPPHIEELNAYMNSIADFGSCYTESLYHLGIGYNKINSQALRKISSCFPNLISLDASNNDLCDIQEVGEILKEMPKLKSLFLKGNPLSLHPLYSSYYIDLLPSLTMLDGVKIQRKEDMAVKTQIKSSKLVFCISLINIEGLQGTELQQENLGEGMNIDTMEEEKKSSQFFIDVSLVGKQYKSKLVQWKSQFVVDPASNLGKAKLGLEIKEALLPNSAILESLSKGIIVKLYENKFVLEKKAASDATATLKCVLKDNAPVKEEVCIGCAKISFPVDSISKSFTKRIYFFSPDIIKLPEYISVNKQAMDPLTLQEKQYLLDKAKTLGQPKQEVKDEKKASKVDKKKEAKKKKEEVQAALVDDIACDSEDAYIILEKSFLKPFERPKAKKKEEGKKDKKAEEKEHYLDSFFRIHPALPSSLIVKVGISEEAEEQMKSS